MTTNFDIGKAEGIAKGAEALTKAHERFAERYAELKKQLLVPGKMHCAKCKFSLNRVNLYVHSGTTSPGDSKTEPCPNGCGPLWPVTWEQEAREGYEIMESLVERAITAEKALPKWLSMDTAPTDGTRVILRWAGKARVGYYLDNSKTATPWAGWKVPSMEEWPRGEQPTGWQPFPEA